MKNNTERNLIVCGLWLHAGFIGAAALVAGLLQLFDGDPTWPWSLGMILSGGVLTVAGWRRGRIVLEDTGRASVVSTDASSEPTSGLQPRQTGRGATATLTLIALRSNTEARQ